MIENMIKEMIKD